MAKADLSAQRLRELLHYDPETGLFVTRTTRCGASKAGTAAGGIHRSLGYRQLMVDGRMYWAHRLAWLYMSGEFPAGPIDHINGDKADNRIQNLRVAKQSENHENRRSHNKNNREGLLGVSRRRGRYVARITVGRKEIHLGTFDTPEEAHAAYVGAKRRFHAGNTL